MKITKRSVAKFLREAARTLDVFGWIQGRAGNYAVGFCAIGALCDVGNNPKIPYCQSHAERALRSRIPKMYAGISSIADWNDSHGRTKSQVTSLLRKTARELEHGGAF